MSFVVTIPEALAAVATDLAGIGSTIGTANAAAAVPTTTVLAAAADGGDGGIVSDTPRPIRALSAQAALLTSSSCGRHRRGGLSVAAEAASAAPPEGARRDQRPRPGAVGAPTDR
ncbi:PE family protein [Mycobacterium tuberculosis]